MTCDRPNKKMKGSCFKAWVEGIKARGYDVDWDVFNCADFGDITTRKRFFLKAVKKGLGWARAYSGGRSPFRRAR